MIDDSDDWGALEAAWRARSEGPPMSLEELEARVQRERVRMRLEIALEAAIAVGCGLTLVWWARDLHGATRAMVTTLAIASLALPALVNGLRRRIWRAHGETVVAYRRLLRRQARLGLLLARVGYVGGPLGIGLGLALTRFGDFAALSRNTAANVTIALVASTALIAGVFWSIREAGRHRRTLAGIAEQEDHRP
jgi:hypothetical protein